MWYYRKQNGINITVISETKIYIENIENTSIIIETYRLKIGMIWLEPSNQQAAGD